MRPAETRLSTKVFSRRPGIILAACWSLVQTGLFLHHGVFAELESLKYIYQAEHLIKEGTVTTSNFWLYSTQIFLIAASKLLGTGLGSVVIIQLFFNALATWSLAKFAARFSNERTGLIVGLIFIFTIPIQSYNFFLQTESLFFSLTILFSCYLLQLTRLDLKSSIFILLFLALICVTRPSGLLWIPCAFLFSFFRFFNGISPWLKAGITATTCIAFLLVLDAALGSGGEFDLMLPFRAEHIICGVPTLDGYADIKTAGNSNSVYGLLYYISNNFEQFARLVWLRSKAFFGLAREYYSMGHNVYLVGQFFPFYFLALFSGRKWWKKNRSIFLYCLSLVLATWGMVILTCDDWHNRFFLSIVPYIYILSIPAISFIVSRFLNIPDQGNHAHEKVERN